MTNISTNAIRAFADKVRAIASSKTNSITLTAADSRNLNHEIQMLLALVVELQAQGSSGDIQVEIKPDRF